MGEPLNIVVWGPTQSGKTALLSFLLHKREKLAWDVRPTHETFVATLGAQAPLQENRFPVSTNVDGQEFAYELTSGERRAFLRVGDRMGGKWTAPGQDETEALTSADALIILIEVGKNPARAKFEIGALLDLLPLEVTSPKPVAVCLTKVDRVIDVPEDLALATSAPEDFVRRHLHEDIQQLIRRRCPVHRFIPVSAVGVRLRHGVIQPSVFRDERLDLRIASESRPLNIVEPFEWIFEQTGRAV